MKSASSRFDRNEMLMNGYRRIFWGHLFEKAVTITKNTPPTKHHHKQQKHVLYKILCLSACYSFTPSGHRYSATNSAGKKKKKRKEK